MNLEKKERLTDAEMEEQIKLSPRESFISLPAADNLGVHDLCKFVKNFGECESRINYALKNGCYIEVISLKMQMIEFWLRMFWVAKNKMKKTFDLNDKRTFGAIMKDCREIGFSGKLIDKLKQFNKDRIDCIHKYILGAICYDNLEQTCQNSINLCKQVGTYVRKEIGIPLN